MTATLIPTVWEISAVESTTVRELGLMPPMIVARNQIQSKIVTEETLAAQLTTPATRASGTVTLTSNVLRGSNAGLTTATRTTQCLTTLMTAVKDLAQAFVMEAILVVLRSTNAMRAKEIVTLTLIVRATLFVASTIVIKLILDLMPLMIAVRQQCLQVLLNVNVVRKVRVMAFVWFLGWGQAKMSFPGRSGLEGVEEPSYPGSMYSLLVTVRI